MDKFLRNALRTRSGIHEIAGASSSGKTQLALQCLVTALADRSEGGLDGDVVCIYTQGLKTRRYLNHL